LDLTFLTKFVKMLIAYLIVNSNIPYTRNLRKFLNLIPNNIFEEYLGESPRSREIEDLAQEN